MGAKQGPLDNVTGTPDSAGIDCRQLGEDIKRWGQELGFQQVGIADTDLAPHEHHLLAWLAAGYQGEMGYMERHGVTRSRPERLLPGTQRVICARMDYTPGDGADPWQVLRDGALGYVSRYALGRDYHRVVRRRLARLAQRIIRRAPGSCHRVYVDSAPVLEKALAERAGLGWIGKHTNLLHSRAGSWFFLGEIYTDLPLPVDAPAPNHCGNCRACIDACPTGAILAPYTLDARRCISYLTIELRGFIPVELRPLVGNRVYGCDDCQLVCPWNRFAQPSGETDFRPRHGLDAARLTSLFSWSEAEFRRRTEGMAVRRTGYQGWLRNVAVALGNAPGSRAVCEALRGRCDDPSALVRDHVAWALARQHTAEHAENHSAPGRSQ